MNNARTFGRRVWFHRDHVAVRHVLFWVAFGMAWLMMALPPARYLFLAMPVLVLLVLVGDMDGRMPEEALPFVAVLVMGLALFPMNQAEGNKDLYLTLSGVATAFLKDWPRVRLWTVMGALLSAFVFLYGVFGDFSGGIHFDFMHSESSFEGNFSFVFALLVPFAVMRKRYGLALLAFALAVLSLKRIAVLAAIAATCAVLLGEKRCRRLLSWPVMLALNIVALAVMMAYALGHFDALILDWTGQSANEFGQGRIALQAALIHRMADEPWLFILGQGAGSVYEMTHLGVWSGAKLLLHCDSLKILYEFGAIFWVFFFWLLYRSQSFVVLVGAAILNVMLLTDNLMSYNFFIFYYLLVIEACRQEMREST